ncbi:AMP-binding protein [Pseudooceanicola sp. 216_PA32_1]|uniref:AMP-binding protein n=1 Tax=Pseudooceanicola pacificus TaxID=2676438 RepID=A0A844W4Z6_9RHOB|nr:non-ribosomal peptide synthetase [Pseudooceanicola pacificus]MWB77784.1 AMP-binding protein [Pseudooceanicola pacificus]
MTAIDPLSLISAPAVAPDAAALVDVTGAQVSHGALSSALDAIGAAIGAQGLAGLRIVTLLPDCPGTLVLLLALMRQAQVMPLSPELTDAELRATLDGAGADVILTVPGAGRGVQGLAPATATAEPGGLDRIDRLAGSIATGGALPPAHVGPGLVLFTSGTTSQPKRVPLRLEALDLSAGTIATHLRLTPSDRAVHMLPMFHIGALVDLCLAPLKAGGSVCLAHPMSADSVARAVLQQGATWLQAVPTMMHALIAGIPPEQAAEMGARLRFVRSVSADLAPELQSRFEQHFAPAPVVQMYGMTEAAGQIASNPAPPDRGRAGSVGRVAGPELQVMDPLGNPLPPGASGEICIAGPQVSEGYENAPRAAHFHGRWLRTGDLGHLDGDGFLFLEGRLKEIINRGGEKIAPTEVERALTALPGLRDVVVFAQPHPTLGEVPAAVVVADDPGFDPQAARAALAEQLAPYKIPHRIAVLDEMPRLRSGKVDRRAAAAALTGGRPGNRQPLSALGARIAAIWADVLQSDRPGPADDFFDMGGDSLSATAFVTALETRLGRELPVDLLYRAPTLEGLEQAIEGFQGTTYHGPLPRRIFRAMRRRVAASPGQKLGPTSLISRWAGAAPGAPLVWSGGEMATILDITGHGRPLYEVQSLTGLPQKSARNTGLLADHYAAELADLLEPGGYAIGGFCQGAVLTRALAERLAARGCPPALFVPLDRHFDRPFTAAPALCVWSQSSPFSAANLFARPEGALPALYPRGAEGLRMPVPHLDLFRHAAMTGILARMDELMADPPRPADPPIGTPAPPRLRIRASGPRRARGGDRVTVQGRLGGLTGPSGGLRIGARWKNLDFHHRMSHAASLPLPGDGAFALEVPVPEVRMPLILEVDVMVDGFFWASDAGRRPWRRLVFIS